MSDLPTVVFEHRLSGRTFAWIATELKLATVRDAFKLFREATRTRFNATIEEQRHLESERLDEILVSLWPAVKKGDPHCAAEARRVIESRRTLLGLDMPRADRKADQPAADPEEAEQVVNEIEARPVSFKLVPRRA